MSVVSARKLAANRANARLSTGPRTAAGRAHSARNAVRHGLSVRLCDPEILRAIEQVGRALAGDAAGEERELAYRVAAAQVEIDRVRRARFKVHARDPIVAAAAAAGTLPAPDAADFAAVEELMSDTVYELEAISRYEARAVARRASAIRALEALRTGEMPKVRRIPGLRVRRWRLPNPFSRVIKFEGLPRWAWWRPDPLWEEPRRRRAPRRKAEPAGELELLVRPEILLQPRAELADAGETDPHLLEPVVTLSVQSSETKPPAPTEVTDAGPALPATEGAATGPMAAETAPALPAVGVELRETKPPMPLPRGWAKPTPLPTCRVGPCRWEGDVPADHWSYRGWRYRRSPALGGGPRCGSRNGGRVRVFGFGGGARGPPIA